MHDLTVTNWFGDVESHPKVVAEANSATDIVAILKDSERYPAPVRAVGSIHSTARCGVADGGTLIKMSKMNRILEIGKDSVTVEAGAIYIDIAKELEKKGLQFYVNTEIGSLSAGSAACAGTKDASMPGESGHVGSYVTRVKMILPGGEILEVSEHDQPELMRRIRSSYGLFGVICEVTFRVRPIAPLAVYHETFSTSEFLSRLPELKARNESMMYYMFPFDGLVTVEFRKYNPGATGAPNRHAWALRNYFWAQSGPLIGSQVERDIPIPSIRYGVIDGIGAMWRFKLTNLIRSDNTIAADQIIRYAEHADDSRYTFSFWAFPEENYPTILPQYFEFCREYYKDNGYRNNLLHVGYRVLQDRDALLSYSYDGNIMTIDPVSTGNPGWKTFLEAYNQFCSNHGGIPLLNQTFGVTRAQAQKAFGARLNEFAEARKTFDPGNRLLNDYFRDLLA